MPGGTGTQQGPAGVFPGRGGAGPDVADVRLGSSPPGHRDAGQGWLAGLVRWLPKGAVIGLDLVAVLLAMVLAYRCTGPLFDVGDNWRDHALVGALATPAWLVVMTHYRLYSSRYLTNPLAEFSRIVHAAGVSVAVMAMVGFTAQRYVSRGWLLLTFAFAVVLLTADRAAVRIAFDRLRLRGRFLRPVVVVGANHEALGLAGMLERTPALGYRVLGFVADTEGPSIGPYRLLARVDACAEAVARHGATGVVIATTALSPETTNRLVRQLTDRGVHVELTSSLEDIGTQRLTIRGLGRCAVVYVEPVRRTGWRALAKRLFDIAFSAVALVVLAPFLAAVAIAVKLDSRGPVFFRQVRVGHQGAPFTMLKFRTMVDGAEDRVIDLRDSNEADGPLFKMADDPRVTRLGRRLRRLSIDELPQFANVLRGEMSVVGPRPALPTEVDAWHPELYQRLWVRPGVTGNWQVHGRGSASFEDYVRLDLYYVDNWSLWGDLSLVLKTIPALLSRRGAS